jgi:hypothetical protein
MRKEILFLIGVLVLIPLAVASTATITNFKVLSNFSDIIAGESTSSEFSFDYPGDLDDDYNDAPLVAIVNITSLDEEYPVWKGDFELSMVAEKYWLLGLIKTETIPMRCSESPVKFKPKEGTGWQYSIDYVPNGSYYCYNADYYMLDLDSRTEIKLNVSSHRSIYPGDYEIGVGLYEMEPDYEGPVIELLEPENDSVIGSEIIEVKLDISDLYTIREDTVRYKIVEAGVPENGEEIGDDLFDSGWIYDIELEGSGLWEAEFNSTEYGLNESGVYWIYAEAKDINYNVGRL